MLYAPAVTVSQAREGMTITPSRILVFGLFGAPRPEGGAGVVKTREPRRLMLCTKERWVLKTPVVSRLSESEGGR